MRSSRLYVLKDGTPIWSSNNGLPSISVRIDNNLLVSWLALVVHTQHTPFASFCSDCIGDVVMRLQRGSFSRCAPMRLSVFVSVCFVWMNTPESVIPYAHFCGRKCLCLFFVQILFFSSSLASFRSLWARARAQQIIISLCISCSLLLLQYIYAVAGAIVVL